MSNVPRWLYIQNLLFFIFLSECNMNAINQINAVPAILVPLDVSASYILAQLKLCCNKDVVDSLYSYFEILVLNADDDVKL